MIISHKATLDGPRGCSHIRWLGLLHRHVEVEEGDTAVSDVTGCHWAFGSLLEVTEHITSANQCKQPVSTLGAISRSVIALTWRTGSLYQDVTKTGVRRLTSTQVHITDFRQHTEITLQDVANWEYTLRLFVENEN